MTPRQKIEGLTRSWYGYSVFAALLSVLSIRASGPLSLIIGLGLSIVLNTIGLFISIAVITYLGRKLAVSRSNPVRLFLVIFSGLFTVLGVLGVLGGIWAFLHEWSLASICNVVLVATCTMLNARSFRVLKDTAVRSYFV
jgi:uncharacterized membrane protein YgaE (UPF0421/DUF939 family)